MKLRNKLLFWMMLVVMLTIAWLGYISLTYIDRIVFDQTRTSMRLAAKQSATEIDKWFETRRVLLTTIATDIETEQYQPDDPRLLAKLKSLQGRLSNYFGYIYIGFENKSMHSTRVAPLTPGFDPTARPWFAAAINKKGFVVTEPYPDRLLGNLVATMAIPVNTPTSGVLGIDVSLTDMMALSKQAVFHSEADAVLVTQNNTILFSTNERLGKPGQPLGKIEYGPLENDILSKRTYYQFERDNVKHIVFLTPIPAANWAIAVALPVSVLFAEQQNLIDRLIHTALVAFIFVVIVIYWIINKVTRPLAGLAATAQKLESGDLNVRFQADESYEATHLADSLDKMRSRLLGTLAEKDGLLEETTAQNTEISALYSQMKALNDDLSKANRDMGFLYTQTIYALSNAIEAKDSYTHGHSSRVLLCAEIMGITLGWDLKTMEQLRYAAILHDIGKIGIPEEILNKPDQLTAEEYEMVKKHPALGAQILQNIPHLEEAGKAILEHHEYFSGGGYPHGIAGPAISPLAKILAISDAYDAMTSGRPYRPALSIEATYDELQRCGGSQFDPDIVKIFCEAIPALAEVAAKRRAV
jgi:putative nucleotidyltransferase with HDIG domain